MAEIQNQIEIKVDGAAQTEKEKQKTETEKEGTTTTTGSELPLSELEVKQKEEEIPKLHPGYVKFHRYTRNVLMFLQILMFLWIYVALHPIFRNHDLLTGTTVSLATFLFLFSGFSVFVSFGACASTRIKYPLATVALNVVCLVSVCVILVLTIQIRQRGEPDSQRFNEYFLKALNENTDEVLKSLHKFQQSSSCCGIPLPSHIKWNQSLIPLGNPWTSWYYHTILDEDYIEEARRLFTLPWSCCSSITADCEHLAFERVSIRSSDTTFLIEDLTEIDRHVKSSEYGRDSVYEEACELTTEKFLDEFPIRVLLFSSFFEIFLLFTVILDGVLAFFSWRNAKK